LPFFKQPVLHDPYIAGLLRRAHVASEEHASALERESRLLWSIAHLVARYADDPPAMQMLTPERERVKKVRAYIDEHYAENVSLDRLAALVNLSPFHLLRMFRKEVGLPPHAYLTQVRVRQAQQLLTIGTPIGLAAADVGFADQSHLTKHFKRFVGVTPGQYAPQRKNIQDNLVPDL
jgi:AraC-like DNA-binding protein